MSSRSMFSVCWRVRRVPGSASAGAPVWKSRRTESVASYCGARDVMMSGDDVHGASEPGSLVPLLGVPMEYTCWCFARNSWAAAIEYYHQI
jgi:hypothetical protein